MEELLSVREVSKNYRRESGKMIKAVDQVSFFVRKGSCLGVVGESGCGKSTLCRMIAGIEKPSDGNICFQGKEYTNKKRNAIQLVFQNSLDAVNLHLNTYQIIAEPLENFFYMKKKERIREVERLLKLVGLKPEDMEKYPQQFSGGQLQRVCIARALAAEPELLLLDEPLSSLDVSVQAQLLNLLADLKKDLNLTCILVSHDLEAVYYLADEIVVMYGGRLMEKIDQIEDFSKLCHPYTRRLLSAHDLNLESDMERKMKIEKENSGCAYAGYCSFKTSECMNKIPEFLEMEKGHWIACHQYHKKIKKVEKTG